MIHINIGSNLVSNFGNKFQNIVIAINLLRNLNVKIKKISNFYETPSYPNKNLPKYVNIGVLIECNVDFQSLFKKFTYVEKKIGRLKTGTKSLLPPNNRTSQSQRSKYNAFLMKT